MYQQEASSPQVRLCPARFYVRAVENKGKSLEEGRPIFDEAEYIEIFVNRNEIVDRKVSDADRHQYSAQYEQFKRNKEQIGDGTPVEQWPALSVSKVATLKSLKIYTVEALAGLRDDRIKDIGLDGRNLVVKAKAFIASSKNSGYVEKLAQEVEALKEREVELRETIKEQAEHIRDLEKELTRELKGSKK